MQRVARTYFTPENRLVLTLMPSGGRPQAGGRDDDDARRSRSCFLMAFVLAPALVAQHGLCAVAKAARAAAAPLARDVSFPPYEMQTLPNGLQVVAVLHHEQPVVSMRMLVRAGSALDPKGKLGLAHLAASLLDQGTTTKSAQEMNDAIDFIGGEMGAGAGTDLTFVNMVVMKDSFDTGLRMLSDMARQPAFAPEEIERQRQQMLSGLQVSFEDPEFIANAVFDRLVYGFHPYGMPETGTPETIAALTRDDLVAFHRRYFAPNNAILAIVGDVTRRGGVRGRAARVRRLGAPRDVPADTFVAPPDPTRRVIVVNKPDAVQTEVRVGHIGISRNHPGLHGGQPRHPHSRRRGQQPAAPGAAHRARPDLRRAGQHGHAEGERRLRRRRPTRARRPPAKCCGSSSTSSGACSASA